MSRLAIAVTLLLSASAISAVPQTRRDHEDCKLTVSLVNIESQEKPSGQIDALIVTGAKSGKTGGGKSDGLPRCVYYYKPDSSSKPSYKGKVWPYVKVPNGCDIYLDDSIPKDSDLRKDGMISMNPDTSGLLVGGLPLYFYHDDPTGEDDLEDASCYCNFGPWSSVSETGQGSAFDVDFVN
eukprot:CFRG7281T1